MNCTAAPTSLICFSLSANILTVRRRVKTEEKNAYVPARAWGHALGTSWRSFPSLAVSGIFVSELIKPSLDSGTPFLVPAFLSFSIRSASISAIRCAISSLLSALNVCDFDRHSWDSNGGFHIELVRLCSLVWWRSEKVQLTNLVLISQTTFLVLDAGTPMFLSFPIRSAFISTMQCDARSLPSSLPR